MRIITPKVIVHGGAFNIPKEFVERYREGTKAAARAGYESLSQNGTAVDAVEKAVNALENNTVFNAGHGSVLTEVGTIEMDAIICDGNSRSTGAVACVSNVANPVTLARKVMEETSHCILCGEGAVRFAKKKGIPILEDSKKLISEESVCKTFKLGCENYGAHIKVYMNELHKAEDMEGLEKAFKNYKEKLTLSENGHDTVGAVAIDCYGNIACATSTGGMPGKMLGRVGDSPLFGLGAYATAVGACSSTGHGESIIKATVCRDAVLFLEQGLSVEDASQKVIDQMLKNTGGRGGIIMIDGYGNVSQAFSTTSMAWAIMSSDGMTSGLFPNEEISE